MRPNGGGPDTPGWMVRVVPNLYPALTPDAREPTAFAKPDLFTSAPGPRARTRCSSTRRRPSCRSASSRSEQVAEAMAAWRERMRTTSRPARPTST